MQILARVADGARVAARGFELQRASGAGALYAATTLGRAAARRLHEYPPSSLTP